MPRKKKLKLTEYEKGLLQYPPTPQTWICQKRKNTDGVVIKHVNAGNKTCLYCTEAKPQNPKLVWPDYISACDKVGIEPGFEWKMINMVPMMRVKGEKWQTAPVVS